MSTLFHKFYFFIGQTKKVSIDDIIKSIADKDTFTNKTRPMGLTGGDEHRRNSIGLEICERIEHNFMFFLTVRCDTIENFYKDLLNISFSYGFVDAALSNDTGTMVDEIYKNFKNVYTVYLLSDIDLNNTNVKKFIHHLTQSPINHIFVTRKTDFSYGKCSILHDNFGKRHVKATDLKFCFLEFRSFMFDNTHHTPNDISTGGITINMMQRKINEPDIEPENQFQNHRVLKRKKNSSLKSNIYPRRLINKKEKNVSNKNPFLTQILNNPTSGKIARKFQSRRRHYTPARQEGYRQFMNIYLRRKSDVSIAQDKFRANSVDRNSGNIGTRRI